MTATAIRPVVIKINDNIKARVKRLADARQRTAHWLMREAFRQDTLNAWEEYRLTGLHVTADAADAWLVQLEQGNDIEPPECHV
jgi:predicted transcriptional regulator